MNPSSSAQPWTRGRKLALVAVVLGVAFACTCPIQAAPFGTFLVGLGLLLPGAWYFHCEAEDTKRLEAHQRALESDAYLKEVLAPGSRADGHPGD